MFAKRAMLVELTIRQWTARKHDKSASNTVKNAHQVAGDGGKYNKLLIAKEALERINRVANELRRTHYRFTLPWGDKGQHLLPARLFMDYRQAVDAYRQEFQEEVDAFISRYDLWVNGACARLGTLFDPSDYPPANEVRSRFSVHLDIFPVPEAGDFRVEVAKEEREELIANIQAASQHRQAEANKACYVRVREVLERMKNQCTVERSRITEALVEDVRDLTQVMDDLNINEDPELSRITREIRDGLVFQADDLRKSPALREAVQDRASTILESLSWS